MSYVLILFQVYKFSYIHYDVIGCPQQKAFS